MFPPTWLIVPALTFLPAAASAEVKRAEHREDGSHYEFRDEPFHAAAQAVNGVVLTVRPRPLHVGLLRPRTHFVPEMLRSVERL